MIRVNPNVLLICCNSALIKTNVCPCVHVCIIKSIPSYLYIKLSFAIWHINCYLPSCHFRKITIVSHFRLDRWFILYPNLLLHIVPFQSSSYSLFFLLFCNFYPHQSSLQSNYQSRGKLMLLISSAKYLNYSYVKYDSKRIIQINQIKSLWWNDQNSLKFLLISEKCIQNKICLFIAIACKIFSCDLRTGNVCL